MEPKLEWVWDAKPIALTVRPPWLFCQSLCHVSGAECLALPGPLLRGGPGPPHLGPLVSFPKGDRLDPTAVNILQQIIELGSEAHDATAVASVVAMAPGTVTVVKQVRPSPRRVTVPWALARFPSGARLAGSGLPRVRFSLWSPRAGFSHRPVCNAAPGSSLAPGGFCQRCASVLSQASPLWGPPPPPAPFQLL